MTMPEQKKAVVPRLRFPEFRDAGPWEVKRLGEICAIKNGSSNAQDHTENGIYPLFDRSEVIKKSNRYLYDCEAVIIPGEGATFTPRYYRGKFDLHQRAYALMGFRANARFVGYQIEAFKNLLVSQAVSSTVLSLRMPILERFTVLLPTGAEQQKIADCLSLLDELIELEAKQLEALQAHKKGLMQQLFPREGETTPRLRFPEFRDAGPWEVKRLGDVVSITGGGTPSRSRKDFWNGNIPWVSSSDVSDESIHELKITRWITSEAVSSSATKIVPENSILLVSRVGVGKVAISRIPVCTSQDFTNLTPLRDDFIFLGYYLSAWANVLKSFGQGMAIQGFKKQDIENLAIPLPDANSGPLPDANSGEQQKIADCLSSLDELIELQAKQLEALQTHKKGLMQQLFPREGETTPRLRFPEFRDAGPWEVKRLGDLATRITEKVGSRRLIPVVSRFMCKSLCTGEVPLPQHLLQRLFGLRKSPGLPLLPLPFLPFALQVQQLVSPFAGKPVSRTLVPRRISRISRSIGLRPGVVVEAQTHHSRTPGYRPPQRAWSSSKAPNASVRYTRRRSSANGPRSRTRTWERLLRTPCTTQRGHSASG